jgi:hypothetical protein
MSPKSLVRALSIIYAGMYIVLVKFAIGVLRSPSIEPSGIPFDTAMRAFAMPISLILLFLSLFVLSVRQSDKYGILALSAALQACALLIIPDFVQYLPDLAVWAIGIAILGGGSYIWMAYRENE